MIKKLVFISFFALCSTFVLAQNIKVIHYDNTKAKDTIYKSDKSSGTIIDATLSVDVLGKEWDQLVIDRIDFSRNDKEVTFFVDVDAVKYNGTGNYEIVFYDKSNKQIQSHFHRYSTEKKSLTLSVPDGTKYAKMFLYISRETKSKLGEKIKFELKVTKGLSIDVYKVRSKEELMTAVAKAGQGDTIKLECGKVFYLDKALNLNSISLTSFGSGPRPVLTGFSVLDVAKEQPFKREKKLGAYIWSINLSKPYLSGSKTSGDKRNVGFIYDRESDQIVFGRKCNFFDQKEMSSYESKHKLSGAQARTYLSKDGDFLQRDENIIYVYSKTNPNKKYNKLEFANHFDAVELDCANISGIKFEGFGKNAIWFVNTASNSVIQDCEFDMLGGSCQTGYDYGQNFIRYGGSIYVWYRGTGTKNILITRNLFKRNFDAAVSPQGTFTLESKLQMPKLEIPENVVVTNNIFLNCRQAYELFYSCTANDMVNFQGLGIKAFSFDHNLCISSGNSGFNSPEERDCHLYNGMGHGWDCKVNDNLFVDGGLWYWINGLPHFFKMEKGNICYLSQNQVLCNGILASKSSISSYRKATNDSNTQINVVSLDELEKMTLSLTRMIDRGESAAEIIRNISHK